MPALYPSEQLFDELRALGPYPEGVVPVPAQMRGLGFFPGGLGVYQEVGSRIPPPFPFGQVMAVGQDFDTNENFQVSLRRGEEDRRGGTWGNLLGFLRRCGIPWSSCFFTNVYMGLRGSGKNTGTFIGSRSPEFRSACERFLIRQLAVQQPKLLLCLGLPAAEFLSRLSVDLRGWDGDSWKAIDGCAVGPLAVGVEFRGGMRIAAVAALVHPSLLNGNVRFRHYRGMHGSAAEEAIVRDAIERSGWP
jgi:hypothetical protein